MKPQMDADERRWELNGIIEKVIGAAYMVGNALGNGFLEKVYENALAYELLKEGLAVQQQKPITVRCDGVVVGEFAADLIVEGSVLVEMKAARALDEIHTAQCLNYLKATGCNVCLLINSGTPRVDVRRIVRGF